jgi:PIN domain nuclease of toxin-antitoxin system
VNYLLDSHTFIWSITEKEKLSGPVRQTFENSVNHSFFVSTITFWEISLKFSTGKLKLLGFSPEEMPELASKSGLLIIYPTPQESASFHNLILTNHKDPFDRMLIWQALSRNLTFISNDGELDRYNSIGLKVLW